MLVEASVERTLLKRVAASSGFVRLNDGVFLRPLLKLLRPRSGPSPNKWSPAKKGHFEESCGGGGGTPLGSIIMDTSVLPNVSDVFVVTIPICIGYSLALIPSCVSLGPPSLSIFLCAFCRQPLRTLLS